MTRIFHKKLVNPKEMVNKAYKGKYAISHFNVNNLEWIKSILEAAQEMKSPVILAASESAIKYMGGFKVVVSMTTSLLEELNITVPVALHLDHGQTVEVAKKAIDSGFSSVMYDGSHIDFEKNIKNTKEVVQYAAKFGVGVESEIGSIGGQEDNVIGEGEIGDPGEAKQMAGLGIDILAAGIGNIHGVYPSNWKGLNFNALTEISNAVKMPMVLHGGSGIPNDQFLKSIKLGISKINIGTQTCLSVNDALRKYYEDGNDKKGKGYDIRKIMTVGSNAIKNTVKELIKLFGSKGKA